MLALSLYLMLMAPQGRAEGAPDPVPESKPAAEYEIDYEEEVETASDSETPAPVKARPKIRSGSGVQGSRALERFSPLLKSETKSTYRKDGKQLDVDPD